MFPFRVCLLFHTVKCVGGRHIFSGHLNIRYSMLTERTRGGGGGGGARINFISSQIDLTVFDI